VALEVRAFVGALIVPLSVVGILVPKQVEGHK
jgi:hypothetical protein